MNLRDLRTPAALVDSDVLERNCDRMSTLAARQGVVLRPHAKTHKCAQIARLQTRGGPARLTVSTMAEARAFAAEGFGDITYAVPVPLAAITEVADLLRKGIRVNLILDSEAALAELEAAAPSLNVRFPAFLKVDCGYHRAGVDPTREESVSLALRVARSPALEFEGILTHAGHAYRCRNRAEILAVAQQERDVTVGFALKLRREGSTVPEVSVGSTPTCSVAEDWQGVTEIRPGNYVFYDASQAAMGTCDLSDALAFTILATVIGHYPSRGEMLINAGALALSKDPGPVHVDEACGYGALFTAGGTPLEGLRITGLSQEHGLVSVRDPDGFGRLPIGTVLRIVPNHSCLAAACFGSYAVLRNGAVVDEWPTARGW